MTRELNNAILEPARETLRVRSRQDAVAEVIDELDDGTDASDSELNKFYIVYDDPKQDKCLGNQGLQFRHSGTSSEKWVWRSCLVKILTLRHGS